MLSKVGVEVSINKSNATIMYLPAFRRIDNVKEEAIPDDRKHLRSVLAGQIDSTFFASDTASALNS